MFSCTRFGGKGVTKNKALLMELFDIKVKGAGYLKIFSQCGVNGSNWYVVYVPSLLRLDIFTVVVVTFCLL